jgi:peptidyl-tRNA hydrolase, PTH1 family
MKILAFLGNPGSTYARTRHNIGFIVGEHICLSHGITASRKNFQSLTGTGTIEGTECLCLFPLTYMNNSGAAVKQAADYYDVNASDIIAVHDEIEFPFGKWGVKFGGGHKGHNGIRSLMQHLGTGEFHRVRVGVGRPPDPRIPVADYVLGQFFPEEIVLIKEHLDEMASLVTSLLAKP